MTYDIISLLLYFSCSCEAAAYTRVSDEELCQKPYQNLSAKVVEQGKSWNNMVSNASQEQEKLNILKVIQDVI